MPDNYYASVYFFPLQDVKSTIKPRPPNLSPPQPPPFNGKRHFWKIIIKYLYISQEAVLEEGGGKGGKNRYKNFGCFYENLLTKFTRLAAAFTTVKIMEGRWGGERGR